MLPLPLFARGKVRDVYEVDADHLLLVASDRLSAYDVVLPTAIPDKGAVLTGLSMWWFGQLADLAAGEEREREHVEESRSRCSKSMPQGRLRL